MIDESSDPSIARFPLWIELSGLPLQLNASCAGGYAWSVFRLIVELDMAQNRGTPGMVEIAPAELALRCGIEDTKIEKAVKAMRKLALMRAFLPDNTEEMGLFQVLTPLPTPQTPDQVRATHGELFLETDWPPRYATEVKDVDPANAGDRDAKIKRVVDLYINTLSMKLNSLVVDQLQMISDRYDMAMIERVFARARKRDTPSLGWILSEIRREKKVEAKAAELRAAETPSSL